ncbi:MAG: thiamine diphosphokinase [Clostridia bacterium]
MKILILANGNKVSKSQIRQELETADGIIAADGGALIAHEMNVSPQYVIGDFDSIDEDILRHFEEKGSRIVRYPREKDETDTHLAVDTALDLGANEIVIAGGIGSRFDHSLGNILLLIRIARRGVRGKIIDDLNEIYVSDSTFLISGNPGETLSILPFSENAFIHRTDGLYYPISNRLLPIDYPYGVSNVFTKDLATIEISSGWVIIIKARD